MLVALNNLYIRYPTCIILDIILILNIETILFWTLIKSLFTVYLKKMMRVLYG